MFFGYNTNGLAHHDLFDAVELLAEIGYRGVAITIDHNALPPSDPQFGEQVRRLRGLLDKLNIRSAIETGARYLLDPRVKHEPTLLSEMSRKRIDFYKHAIDCAAILGSECVSIWSGALRGGKDGAHAVTQLLREQSMNRLVTGLREVLCHAAAREVVIAFEPEPGMFIDTMEAFGELMERIADPSLRLTLDVGHLQCQRETPIAEVIHRWGPLIANVHIEDMRAGVHEHLMFGEGEIAFPPVFQALCEEGYAGGVYVELSRHSREGPAAARQALRFLRECVRE
jgi:L-ribulose-5-phosphate 3-epimerase